MNAEWRDGQLATAKQLTRDLNNLSEYGAALEVRQALHFILQRVIAIDTENAQRSGSKSYGSRPTYSELEFEVRTLNTKLADALAERDDAIGRHKRELSRANRMADQLVAVPTDVKQVQAEVGHLRASQKVNREEIGLLHQALSDSQFEVATLKKELVAERARVQDQMTRIVAANKALGI